MRKLVLVVVLTIAAGAFAQPAAADSGELRNLSQPRPAWLTDKLEAKIIAAGAEGVEVRVDRDATELNCLGTAPPYAGTDGVSVTAVAAGACMVSPSGCTMNFVFNDGASNYIGTAGHCVAGGNTVIAQIATRVDPTDSVVVTLAAIGSVVKSVNQGIGKDFALVRINPGLKVMPGVAGALGPTGVFCGRPRRPARHALRAWLHLLRRAGDGEVRRSGPRPDARSSTSPARTASTGSATACPGTPAAR